MPVMRNCSPSVPFAAGVARSGTTRYRIAAVARQRPASQKNRPCQLMTDSDHCTGSVAAMEPRPPAIMWKPVIRPQRSGGYHIVMALMAAIRPPAKPSPISTRATISSPSDRLRPNRAEPSAAVGQQHGLDAARPVAVEHDAQHRLAAGEEQEEGRGQQPEIARGDADVPLEIGEDHRVHAAEDVGQEISERERQEDPQEERGEGRGVSGHACIGAGRGAHHISRGGGGQRLRPSRPG